MTERPIKSSSHLSMAPSRSSLQALIEGCGITLSPRQYDLLWQYHGMLRRANPELNLTRIHNFENMVLKHYVDSLLVLKFESLPSSLLDLGTGPGLPGIALKIASPETHIILAEGRGARVKFLREVCERLGLEQIEVHDGKIGPRFTRPVQGVITRAVASIGETLDLVSGCLPPGGRVLFMKGPGCDDEIAAAAQTHAESFQLKAAHAYDIPGTTHARRLLVYERQNAPALIQEAKPQGGPIKDLTSESNPTFRLMQELLTGRGIRKHDQALMAGSRLIRDVLARTPEFALAWVTETNGPEPPIPGLAWYRLADRLFKELDTSGTHAPLLLVRVPEMPAWTEEATWPAGCTLFVPFQDPENVGAVIRAAAAFGVGRVVLLREAAHPFHPRSLRAAGPAIFQVVLEQGPSIQDLSCRQAPLVALAMDGPELPSYRFPDQFGLVAGLEGPGLPERLREGLRVRIPMAEAVESLNAASAVAVALYEWRRQQAAAALRPLQQTTTETPPGDQR